jgi:hypothetical protein
MQREKVKELKKLRMNKGMEVVCRWGLVLKLICWRGGGVTALYDVLTKLFHIG